jgi:type IV pilus assembly protein PilF
LLYARLGDNVKADSDFRSALRLAPKDPELANNYAVYLCGQGRTAEGVKRFEQAAADQLYASPWAAYTNAGVCLWGAKQLPEAEAQFRRALQLRPNYSEAVYQLAALELAQRKAAASAARVEAYVAGNLAQPEMLLLGWLSWCEVKDKVAALKMARRLQTQYPDAAETRAALKGCGNG